MNVNPAVDFICLVARLFIIIIIIIIIYTQYHFS